MTTLSLITVYNCDTYLQHTLNSVESQTSQDFEYVLESTTEDKGCVNTLSQAILKSQGEYFAYVDADDFLEPDAVQTTLDYIQQYPNIGLFYSKHNNVNSLGDYLSPGKNANFKYSKIGMLVENITFHLRVIKRSYYDLVGGLNLDYKVANDYELNLRLTEVTDVIHIPKVLYNYRQHPNQVSANYRLEQITNSEKAIRAALIRRNLNHTFQLDVDYDKKLFTLSKKNYIV